MHVVDIIIPVVWIAFWVYWFAAATRTKATSRRSASSLPIRVAILALLLFLLQRRVFKGHSGATIHNTWLEGIGFAVFVLGLLFAVWARIYIGRNWGTPMSQKVDPELVTTGPYRYVRHPIYSGIIFGMIGTAIAISLSWFVAVVLLGAYFIYSATVEERNLAHHFPATYPAYKRSTKMLIPFIF
jgi:protein-S-isoprenylcysteine O-methyltransferase Ste14